MYRGRVAMPFVAGRCASYWSSFPVAAADLVDITQISKSFDKV